MIKKLKDILFSPLKVPYALTSVDWDEWHENNKEKHPFLYWLYWDFDIWCSVRYRMYVTDPIWWVKHRFIKKHKYHLIDTGLPPSYYDPRDMLDGAIPLMVHNYIKDNHFVWESTQSACDAMTTFQNFDKWFYVIKPMYAKIVENLYENCVETNLSNVSDINANLYKRIRFIENKMDKIDVSQMQKLMKHYKNLWY